MQIVPMTMTVADYCNALDRGEVVVNKKYQRSEKIWPPMARSFLIETILLGYPVPKLSLYQVTDLRSRATIKEIVDGQQRTRAIHDFFGGSLRLSPSLETEEARNRTYDELDTEFQGKFLDYLLTFDLFVAANEDEVRQVFRRINSFTVPLNPEERRHALYQGSFKWFIYRLAHKFDDAFVKMGLFGEKQLVRMSDTKLLAEVSHAYFNGIKTTNARMLDALYKSKDKEFPEEEELEAVTSDALDELLAWEDIHNTSLMKPHLVYSLVLAIMHMRASIASLEPDFESSAITDFDQTLVITNLSALADALDDPDNHPEFLEFTDASSEKTNVGAQRKTRFQWMCRSLIESEL